MNKHKGIVIDALFLCPFFRLFLPILLPFFMLFLVVIKSVLNIAPYIAFLQNMKIWQQ